MTGEAPNTINDVMSLDPLSLSARDLDTIIAYSRKQRLLIEGGGKRPKRGAALESEEQIDLQALGLVKKTTIKRRI